MSRKCIVFSQTFNAIQGTPQQVIEWPKWILGTERRRMGHFSLFKANSQVIRKKVHIWFRRLWFFIGFSYPVFGAHGPRLESTWEPAIVFYISHLIQMESFAEIKRPTRRNFFLDILDFQRLKTTGYVVLLYFTACSFFMLLPFPLTRVSIHLKSLKGFSVTWKLTANHGAISCSHFYYFTSLLRRRAEDVTFPSLFQDLLHDSPMIAEENG